MIVFLKGWVVNIVVLAMFIVLMEMLLPSGKTKKIVNMISGFLLIIAIINPIMSLLNKGVNFENVEITNSNYMDAKVIEQNSKVLEGQQMKLIVEEYRRKIISQLEKSCEPLVNPNVLKADVIINEDYATESFGEIKRVYLNIISSIGHATIEPIRKVEAIDFNKKSSEKTESEVESHLKKSLEDKVISIFAVDRDVIVISLN